MYFLYEGDERNQMGVLVIFCSPKIAFSFISAKGTRLGMEKKPTHTFFGRFPTSPWYRLNSALEPKRKNNKEHLVDNKIF